MAGISLWQILIVVAVLAIVVLPFVVKRRREAVRRAEAPSKVSKDP